MIEATRVVVGVDGSLGSLAAVRRAAEEARRRDALLVALAAWMVCDGDSLRPLSELEYAARVRLDSVVELAFDGAPRGVRIHPQVVRSEAGPALVAAADGPQDLLVVGSGRHTGRRGLLHGSVTRYCFARAAVRDAETGEKPRRRRLANRPSRVGRVLGAPRRYVVPWATVHPISRVSIRDSALV